MLLFETRMQVKHFFSIMLARGYTDVSIGCNHGIGIEISEKKKYTDVEV